MGGGGGKGKKNLQISDRCCIGAVCLTGLLARWVAMNSCKAQFFGITHNSILTSGV